MIDSPFTIILADYAGHSILVVDVPTGEIVTEIPYSAAIRPVTVILTEDRKTAYIPAAGNNGRGVLFAVSLDTSSLYQLPVDIPHPVQFILAPGGKKAYFADPGSTLYSLDLVSMERKEWGQMPEDTNCVGMAADADNVYTAWEHASGGTIASFSIQGELKQQKPLAGFPTYLSLTKQGELLVPYAASPYTGEGVAIFPAGETTGVDPSAVITIQCPFCYRGIKAYPGYIALSPDEKTAYVVNEDSSSLTVIDITRAAVTQGIPLGHSVTQICISPDGRFAVGASHRFADLCLIDLVNQRLISVTDTRRELSGFIVAV
jgi:YVTN family beta-propeller protein